ncbi:MAG: hypothetical protein EB127_26685, partial [Alphaproteobacteria bacterium]|nr:hypothetical protein [Alphaproteobacteria bacterium]
MAPNRSKKNTLRGRKRKTSPKRRRRSQRGGVGAAAPVQEDYDRNPEDNTKPNILTYKEKDSNSDGLHEKIQKIYEDAWNQADDDERRDGFGGSKWVINFQDKPEISSNIYFYILSSDKTKIVSIVRITNDQDGQFARELGYDTTLQSFRNKGLYKALSQKRFDYVQENYPGIYTLYTMVLAVKDMTEVIGMTFVKGDKPGDKTTVDGKDYWKFEMNRWKGLAVNTNMQCSGFHLGN